MRRIWANGRDRGTAGREQGSDVRARRPNGALEGLLSPQICRWFHVAGSRSSPSRSDPVLYDPPVTPRFALPVQGVIDLNVEISHGALELGVTQQELDCTQV